jgi:hypothetical protein
MLLKTAVLVNNYGFVSLRPRRRASMPRFDPATFGAPEGGPYRGPMSTSYQGLCRLSRLQAVLSAVGSDPAAPLANLGSRSLGRAGHGCHAAHGHAEIVATHRWIADSAASDAQRGVLTDDLLVERTDLVRNPVRIFLQVARRDRDEGDLPVVRFGNADLRHEGMRRAGCVTAVATVRRLQMRGGDIARLRRLAARDLEAPGKMVGFDTARRREI